MRSNGVMNGICGGICGWSSGVVMEITLSETAYAQAPAVAELIFDDIRLISNREVLRAIGSIVPNEVIKDTFDSLADVEGALLFLFRSSLLSLTNYDQDLAVEVLHDEKGLIGQPMPVPFSKNFWSIISVLSELHGGVSAPAFSPVDDQDDFGRRAVIAMKKLHPS